MRFVGGVVAGVACVAAVASFASVRSSAAATGAVLGAGQSVGSWATAAELSWLRRVGGWNARRLDELSRGAAIRSTCAADLRAAVGPAPTERLRRPFVRLERACARLTRGDTVAAADLLLAADRLLPPGEGRPLPVVAGDSTASRVEPSLGRVAGRVARKEVEVRCWSDRDWAWLLREEEAYTRRQIDERTLGFVGIGGSRVNLAPGVCRSLAQLVYAHARPADPDALYLSAAAVATLAHEAQHAKGIADEAQAECYAIQLLAGTAHELGVDHAYAERLAVAYWRQYPAEAPAYRSPQCRDGGRLDLREGIAAWP